jgi:hypothetical protein
MNSTNEPTKANKTDAGNGSKAIGRVIEASRSPAHNPSRWPINMPDYSKLIPSSADWNHGKGTDPETWLSFSGSFELTIAFGTLFWPEFTTHEDCVFFAPFTNASRASYQGFMEQTKGNKRSVEVVMNHRHILDLFPSADTPPSREQVLFIGRMLQDIWQTKLNREFPDRTIRVSFPEDHSEDLRDYEITFFQEDETN